MSMLLWICGYSIKVKVNTCYNFLYFPLDISYKTSEKNLGELINSDFLRKKQYSIATEKTRQVLCYGKEVQLFPDGD